MSLAWACPCCGAATIPSAPMRGVEFRRCTSGCRYSVDVEPEDWAANIPGWWLADGSLREGPGVAKSECEGRGGHRVMRA